MDKKTLKEIAKNVRAIASQVEAFEPCAAYVPSPFDPASESPLEYAKRIMEEAKENADPAEANRRAMLKLLQDGYLSIVKAHELGELKDLSKGIRRAASEAASEGKVSATANEFRAALSGEKGSREELLEIAENAAKLRELKDSKRAPWSEIETTLNLTENTRAALYNVSKEFPDLFTEYKK